MKVRTATALLLAAAVAVASCAPIQPGLLLELTDRSITADRAVVPAGHLVFAIHNNGTVGHELVVMLTDAAAEMAFDAGVAEPSTRDAIAERENIVVGATKRLSVDLAPGRYLLLCNLPGHYTSGMHVALEAR